MKFAGAARLGLVVAVALSAWTGIMAQQSGGIDVSGYPAETQRQYKAFAEKCSRCHDLNRSLMAKYTTEAQWRDLVERMARKPGAGISRRDRASITAFLVFHQQARAGGSAGKTDGATATASKGGDISTYPADVQRKHKTFAEKCIRCHDLNRGLTARYTGEAQWRDLVVRMARKPGAGISRRDVSEITSFLVFHEKARGGQTPAPAADGDAAPPQTPETPAAADAGADAGVTAGGLRVEGELLPARSITVPADGGWRTENPAEGENTFLSVRLSIPATGEKVPYATVRARLGESEKELRPLFGAKGLYYGRNFAAPEGAVSVALQVEPPMLGRVNDEERPWSGPVSVKLMLKR